MRFLGDAHISGNLSDSDDNAVYIIKGYKVQLTIIFLDDHGKNCHLNFGNDKDQVTFFYVTDSGPLHLPVFLFIRLDQNSPNVSSHLSFDISITRSAISCT